MFFFLFLLIFVLTLVVVLVLVLLLVLVLDFFPLQCRVHTQFTTNTFSFLPLKS